MSRTGEVADSIGVSDETIRQWTDKDEFVAYFTKDARGINRRSRRYSQDDVLILNTINYLRNQDSGITWREIADRLETGFRHDEFPSSDIAGVTTKIPYREAEQSAKAAATMVQRDEALLQIQHLKNEMVQLRTQYERRLAEKDDELERRLAIKDEVNRELITIKDQEIRDLNKEIARLNREIGRLEGQFNKPKDKKGENDDDDN